MNYLVKIIKYIPRKIKEKLLAGIKAEIAGIKSEIIGIKKTFLVNKLFLKQCAEIFSGVEFVGQELQDIYAYLYFKGKRDGFFIDIGAYDGITT